MLTRILTNSEALCTFVDGLGLQLSRPQRRHMLNLADALLVCEDEKTLAALQRQFLAAPDASNMADFLRISPWSAGGVRNRLRAQQVVWALAEAERTGAPKVIYVNLDDSLGVKHPETQHLEPVDWHYDHGASSGHRQRRYHNAICYLVCTLRIGQVQATVDLRLYVRASTLRRINRRRPAAQRIRFHSKTLLARQMLAALAPLLPRRGWRIYLQCDAWYASKRLLRFARRQGWHVTCALRSNRKLGSLNLRQHAQALWHQRYTRIAVTVADGPVTYCVRQVQDHLAGIPGMVRVFISKRQPRSQLLLYFACTDLTLSAQQALQGYHGRWSCEMDHFYLKTQLGLADFRVQSYEAVTKYLLVVHLAWAYVERRFSRERGAQIQCFGDIIRRHRDEHAVCWLTGALEAVLETGDIPAVLQRFLRQPALLS
jgi:DDE superfamily endonuclease